MAESFRQLPVPDFGGRRYALDSLKLRIPYDLISVVDENLNGTWVMVNDLTGEVDDRSSRKNSIVRERSGITTSWKLDEMTNIDGRNEVDRFLTVTVPAKLLGGKYFQGINYENAFDVYDALLKEGVATFSKETFMEKSACTDMDFKTDFVLNDDFPTIVNRLKDLTKQSNKKGDGCRTFLKKDNQGIEFSERRTPRFRSQPYLKIYHKSLELMHQSSTFAKTYLNGVDFQNIARIETTVKNKAHVRHLWNIDGLNMKNAVSLPDADIEKAFTSAFRAHLDVQDLEGKTRNRTVNDLSGKDLIIYNSMEMIISSGVEFHEYLDRMLSAFDDKVTRSRQRKLLNNLYEIYKYERGQISDFVNVIDDYLIDILKAA